MRSSWNNAVHPDLLLALVRQTLYQGEIQDMGPTISQTISRLALSGRISPGDSVAVAVGSRGIDKIHQVTSRCIHVLQQFGLQPFIVPAMGSHGGATPEGQKQLLAKFGITETAMGVPVRGEMNTVVIGELESGLPLHMAQTALQADHLVLINRIKPHTKFSAPIESGLCKMLTIGLGKAVGAAAFHQHAVRHGFQIIEAAAARILPHSKLLFGLALLEDGHGRLAHIQALSPETMIREEKELLKQAYTWLGQIPFDPIDILIVDYIGKDISGIGMDSNVTGRHRDITGDFFSAPHPGRIFVRDLSPLSDGNGNGIGLADVTTTRLVKALDMAKTYTNSIAAISPEKAAIPMHFASDRQALQVCVQTLGLPSLANARIVRIKNTADLRLLQISKALEPFITKNHALQMISPWTPLHFDAEGNLPPLPEP